MPRPPRFNHTLHAKYTSPWRCPPPPVPHPHPHPLPPLSCKRDCHRFPPFWIPP
jgi:hypothetical protein